MRLSLLVERNLRRSPRRLALVSVAVAVGVAIMLILGALGVGLRRGVLAPLLPRLPLGVLKVEPRTTTVGLLAFDTTRLGGGFDERTLERMRALEGVRAVHGVAGLAFPMRAEGGEGFLGRRLRTDLFATGLAEEVVRDELPPERRFLDPGPSARRVPVLVSRRLLDLYNTTVAPAIDKPRLSPELVIGFAFELELGASYASGVPDPARVRRVEAEVVGFSERANLVGISLPLALVERWNAEQGKAETPLTGAFVYTASPDAAGRVAQALEAMGLVVDEGPKWLGAGLAIGGALAALLVACLLLLAGLAIAQTFLLLVTERWSELAILRAMGARRSDVLRLVLAEAAVAGALGATAGLILGAGAALGLERLVLALLPPLPFTPTLLVAFPPWVLVVVWTVGLGAALGGAFLPAWRAARAGPAQALRG